jgi:hypothetical protein
VEELREHGQRGRERKPQAGERGAAALVPTIRAVEVGQKRPGVIFLAMYYTVVQ